MMKKLLLSLLLLAQPAQAATRNLPADTVQFTRKGSAPSSPVSSTVYGYVLDSDGKFYIKNSSGTAKACTYSGDIVNADLTGSAGITNANLATMENGRFKCRTSSGTGAPEDCTPTQAQAILGTVPQLLAHQSTPSSPPSGSVYFYVKSDNNAYLKDSGGTETQIGGSVGGASFASIDGGDTDGTYGSYHCEIFTTTGDRTLTVTTGGPVMFAMVGGGGGGAWGGGGGGGVIDHYWEDVLLDAGSYTVHVGAGGAAGNAGGTSGTTGEDTTFAGYAAKGGGGGGTYEGPNNSADGNGKTGGSGGGGGNYNTSVSNISGTGGSGTFNKPEVQGYSGGAGGGASGGCYSVGGGGGAGSAGATGSSGYGGAGGNGLRSVVATLVNGGTAVYWGGGGGAGQSNSGGSCAGSAGAIDSSAGAGQGANGHGTANTGGGGGGGCSATGTSGGNGGSGKAIICARIAGS